MKLNTTLSKDERILGAFYGMALGDAMGMPSELWPRVTVKKHFGWIDSFLDGPEENTAACFFKAGQFTDDTSMALALADAIVEGKGQIDPKVVARNIMCWADGFDAFNKNVLGPSSKIALRAIKNGDDIALLDNLGTTNGAAMRVAPLGCLMPTSSPSEFISLVEVASSPTHKSDVAVAGAVVIAWAVSKAIDGETWSDILTTLPGIADKAQDKTINTFSPRMSSRIKLALDVVARHSGIEEASEAVYNFVGAGTSTIESVPAAIAMVELAKCDAKTCAILCANLGGDTDTIGAMATAICGAINGFSSLDKQLIQQLDDANKVDFRIYTKEFLQFRAEKEVSYASR